jgi:hypothetical protein
VPDEKRAIDRSTSLVDGSSGLYHQSTRFTRRKTPIVGSRGKNRGADRGRDGAVDLRVAVVPSERRARPSAGGASVIRGRPAPRQRRLGAGERPRQRRDPETTSPGENSNILIP